MCYVLVPDYSQLERTPAIWPSLLLLTKRKSRQSSPLLLAKMNHRYFADSLLHLVTKTTNIFPLSEKHTDVNKLIYEADKIN